MANCLAMGTKKNMSAQDMIIEESPASTANPKRILVVMDALKEFSIDLLEGVLKNFTLGDSCSITLLGIMPFLNIPLSSKTWSDIWSMNLEDLSSVLDNCDLKIDYKYHKVERLYDLCQKYRVVPEIKTEIGYPLRLLVAEQISSLHATLVIFDRYHEKRYIDYYAEKIPCKMVVMNNNGEVGIVRKRKLYDDSDIEDAASATIPPRATSATIPSRSISFISSTNISRRIKQFLKPGG